MHELFSSEANIKNERHAPHRYHGDDAFSAFESLARNTNFWRANTRLATGVRLKASPPQAVLVDFLARRAGICTTRYDHFSPPFLEKHHRPHRCQPWRRSTSLHTEFPMIGLVIVTHGRLADEFRAALEHVMGPQKQIEAITIGAEDEPELCRSDIIEAVNRVDSGNGVAILTDMFGGTPSNLAISCMSRPKVEVLAGINLPLLVKLAKVREEHSLPVAIAMAQEAGRKYVTIASRVLAGKSG